MSWFGADGEALEAVLGLPRVVAEKEVGSTMDIAHAIAADGAPAGSLVIAESQSAGRGRSGKSWISPPRSGLAMTLVERPRDSDGVDVLSLRVGLHLAPKLDRWSQEIVMLKWPNDLYVSGRKLGGILIEARWRGGRLDWVAIGIGVNLVVSDGMTSLVKQSEVGPIGLHDVNPLELLGELVPAVRAAAFATGPLGSDELHEFARRDFSRGKKVIEPLQGVARGISSAGELLVEGDEGVSACRSGSLVFANDD